MSDPSAPAAPGPADQLRAALEEIEQLKVALVTRHDIGMAQGMLMLRYGISAETAFEYLARRSQDENIKLRDLAPRVVADLSELRWPEAVADPAPPPEGDA
jgi:AmiR/NasT family two-component response regulator